MAERLAISLKHVNKDFRLPHEKPTGIKQAIIKFKPGKKYEVQRVLRDVSFDVKEGEFFGIVGRNGSGKSTLLKILAQIYVPNKGKVTVNGSLTPFIELGVGFNAELTGRENVYLNGALLGFDRKQMDEIYDDIVDFAEIGRFMDQKLKNYSSGMQVRLAFSIAIRANSDILLIDEVLAVGDAAFQQKCFDYFEELKRRKRTVVLVTHDMAAVRRFCTRAIYLKDSRLILDGTVQEIADLYLEENINVGDGEAPTEEKAKADQPVVNCKILKQSPTSLSAEISFNPKGLNPAEYYVGFSVMFNGMSVAERNSLHSDKNAGFNDTHKISLELPLTDLNAGVYQLSAAVFKKHNKELVASTTKRPQFVIKGNDESLGGAMRLPDVWR